MVLQSNEWGQTLREVAIRYGRRVPDATLLPTDWDRDQQIAIHVTYTENKDHQRYVMAMLGIRTRTVCPSTARCAATSFTGVEPAGNADTAFTFEQIFSCQLCLA